MTDSQLEKMPLDDLWQLHERINLILKQKLEDENRKLQRRLDELGRRFSGSHSDHLARRPYPKVEPKFRNPEDPSETWSGRGKQARWVIALLAAGRTIDDLRILETQGSFVSRQRTMVAHAADPALNSVEILLS
jgi:DNA-binding protein H-NS